MSTLLKVTISGPPGSGTSTLVAKIAESRGWRSMNGGDVFREEARSRGLSVEELSAEAKEDTDVDRHLDELLQKRMSSPESPEIVESRLSGWWAHKNDLECLRVWVSVSDKERARRIPRFIACRPTGPIEKTFGMRFRPTFIFLYGNPAEIRSPFVRRPAPQAARAGRYS